jgi:hypothetical protein
VYKRLYEGYWEDTCSSNDLKIYDPHIVISKSDGHSCNCTFVFLVLKELGLVEIKGNGVRGNPFYVIKSNKPADMVARG